MTARELIEALKGQDPEALVICPWYEDGWGVAEITTATAYTEPNPGGYRGEWRVPNRDCHDLDDKDEWESESEARSAVLIFPTGQAPKPGWEQRRYPPLPPGAL